MNLNDISCRKCGGKLKEIGAGKYKCLFCGSDFFEDTVQKEVQALSSILDAQKQETLSNLKRLLWNELQEENIDSAEIVSLCKEIKKIYPDDFYANLYEVLNGGNDKKICRLLDKFDVTEKFDDVPDILNFMFKSLTEKHLLSVSDLIERAYKNNRGLYEQKMTAFEKEAEKVKQGVYDPSIPRDVFIMYSSADIEKVKELTEYLEEQGISCFVAARNLQHGRGAVENYQPSLEIAMDNCKVIVFVSSANSRSNRCDAVRLEMPYIKNKDLLRAPVEYASRYDILPDKYRKPRVEYVIDEYTGKNIIEKLTKEFFGTLQWAQSEEAVAERVMRILCNIPQDRVETSVPEVEETIVTEEETIVTEVETTVPEVEESEEETTVPEVEEIEEETTVPEVETIVPEVVENEEETIVIEEVYDTADFVIERGVLKEYKGKGGKVVVPGNVTSIGSYAFYSCTTIESLVILKSVTSVGDRAFSGWTATQKIYCEHKKSGEDLPDGWDKNALNNCNATVIWGYNHAEAIKKAKEEAERKAKEEAERKAQEEAESKRRKFAERKARENGFEVKDGKLTKYNGKGGDIVIPDCVTSIGNRAFYGCTSLTSVTIPNSVTSIGEYAFYGCTSLTSVTIPDSVTSIGEWAFERCTSLKSVTIPNSVTSIGEWAFGNCTSLKSVTIPNSVTSIGEYAFYGCTSIANVTIPNSVTSIDIAAFENCSLLSNIFVDENNKNYKSINGNLYTKDGKQLVQYAIGKKQSSFTIPDSVTSIGERAFYGCESLTSVIILDSVLSIGKYAFRFWTKKQTIYCECKKPLFGLPKGWDKETFTECKAKIVWGYTKVSRAKENGFIVKDGVLIKYKGKGGDIVIPDCVTSIGEYAFRNCTSLTSVTIPDSVTSIGYSAFDGCKSLTSVIIPNTVTSIGYSAFGFWTKEQTIYCECEKPKNGLPKGWNSDTFKYCEAKIVWGYKEK